MSRAPRQDEDFYTSLEWLPPHEGQLAVDVVETPERIIVRSAIAGVNPEDLDINVTTDTVTIRGSRTHAGERTEADVIHIEECYWGGFSRSVVLPCQVKPEEADAALKNGILTITLPKAEMASHLDVIPLD